MTTCCAFFEGTEVENYLCCHLDDVTPSLQLSSSEIWISITNFLPFCLSVSLSLSLCVSLSDGVSRMSLSNFECNKHFEYHRYMVNVVD